MAGLPPYPGTPRWVKVFRVIAIGLVVLAIIMAIIGIGGPHGPGRHVSPGDAGSQAATSNVSKECAPSVRGIDGK